MPLSATNSANRFSNYSTWLEVNSWSKNGVIFWVLQRLLGFGDEKGTVVFVAVEPESGMLSILFGHFLNEI